jgi:pimeloyl-ACP methyl ester carboxylesterase
VSIAYAARHPERVSHLVLVNSYLRGRYLRAANETERRDAELQVEMAVVGWGRDDVAYRHFFASQFLPGGTPELWDAFAELQRRTTSAENAQGFFTTYARIDVTELARTITVPTIVLHARDDLRVPYAQAREIAAAIPGSRLVPPRQRQPPLPPRRARVGRRLPARSSASSPPDSLSLQLPGVGSRCEAARRDGETRESPQTSSPSRPSASWPRTTTRTC